MKSKTHFITQKSYGTTYTLNSFITNSPKGDICTLEIVDNAVTIFDKPATGTMIMTFNEMDLDNNKEQLKDFCKFWLKRIKKMEKNERKNS